MKALRHISSALLLLGVSAAAEAPHPLMPTTGPYRLYETPERTDLLTPEGGRKEVYGDFGPVGQKSYRVEIPIAALKATPTATAAATAPPPTAVVTWATPQATAQPTAVPPTAAPSPTGTATPLPTATALACETTPPVRKTASRPESTDDIDPLVVKANRLFNQRKYVEASEYVDEILRRRPEYVRGWLMRGSLHKMLGHRDLAREAWDKAQALAGDDGDVARQIERYR